VAIRIAVGKNIFAFKAIAAILIILGLIIDDSLHY
jgi:hypothetical protein